MKRFIYTLFFLTLCQMSFGQYKFDYGLKIGGANYLGDIGGKELTRRDFIWDMHLNQTRLALGAYGRYKFSRRFSLAANLSYLNIRDTDTETTNPARRARNLNFRNRIWELGLRGEVTIFYDNDVGGKGYYNPDFKLYAFAGISGFYHNPQGQIKDPDRPDLDDGTWYDLRPWRTEGQDEEYETIGLAIPAGFGLYFTWNKMWRVGWELSWRLTFTDYLDDISTVYADPDLLPSDLARAFASQTSQSIIDEIDDPASGTIFSHQYVDYGGQAETKRGESDNNDNFLSSTISIGRVIRGRSKFYRKKYSWLKNRVGRKTRAKF
jgi:hypothetical protein